MEIGARLVLLYGRRGCVLQDLSGGQYAVLVQPPGHALAILCVQTQVSELTALASLSAHRKSLVAAHARHPATRAVNPSMPLALSAVLLGPGRHGKVSTPLMLAHANAQSGQPAYPKIVDLYL